MEDKKEPLLILKNGEYYALKRKHQKKKKRDWKRYEQEKKGKFRGKRRIAKRADN